MWVKTLELKSKQKHFRSVGASILTFVVSFSIHNFSSHAHKCNRKINKGSKNLAKTLCYGQTFSIILKKVINSNKNYGKAFWLCDSFATKGNYKKKKTNESKPSTRPGFSYTFCRIGRASSAKLIWITLRWRRTDLETSPTTRCHPFSNQNAALSPAFFRPRKSPPTSRSTTNFEKIVPRF